MLKNKDNEEGETGVENREDGYRFNEGLMGTEEKN